jgi:hypothetical protein
VTVAILVTTGCATVKTKCIPIELPQPPIVPLISAAEMDHVRQDVYEKLVERDAMQAAHINTLHDIADAHNKACN